MALVEVIACTVRDAVEAERGGAGRIEVVRNLERGGLTPSLPLVRRILKAVSIPVRVMIREGDGYEVRSPRTIARLSAQVRAFSALPVDGLVVGFLRDGAIDAALTRRVLSAAPRLTATFHHALENSSDPLGSIALLRRFRQIDRILVHGRRRRTWNLKRYHEAAGRRIRLLAGGGLDGPSAASLIQTTPVREFHFGRAARRNGKVESSRVRGIVDIIAAHDPGRIR